MSAFVVSDKTIAGILQVCAMAYQGDQFSYYYNGQMCSPSDMHGLGQVLVDENYRSFNYRYAHKGPFKPHVYKHVPIPPLPAVAQIKLIQCLDYQSCETDDWQESRAYAICEALKHRAIDRLPGYEDAAWEIN